MGNCTVRGTTVGCSVKGAAVSCSSHRATAVAHVRVVTDTGRVIEFEGPVPAGDVLVGFPRHGIFRQGNISSPLHRHEQLQNGRLYYLLPLERKRTTHEQLVEDPDVDDGASGAFREDLQFSSGMVCEHVKSLEVLPPQMNGIWRVKMAISAERLAGILSEQVNAEALIERMRMLAITAEAVPAHAKLQRGGATGWKPSAVALPMASKVRPCDRMW